MRTAETKAVFFDVDFTLIYPGPMFRGEGYREFCARHGIEVDASKFPHAVVAAAPLLDRPEGDPYADEIFIVYTRRIIEGMGGTGPNLDACAQEIYREWAACQHFELYDDVPDVLSELAASGVRIGLISNTQRCLASFQSHFELNGLISATMSRFLPCPRTILPCSTRGHLSRSALPASWRSALVNQPFEEDARCSGS